MWNIQLEHDVLWKLRALIPAISVAGGQKPPDSGPTCELDFCNATVHCPYKKWWQLTTQNCHGKIWQICCHQFEGIYTQNSYKAYCLSSNQQTPADFQNDIALKSRCRIKLCNCQHCGAFPLYGTCLWGHGDDMPSNEERVVPVQDHRWTQLFYSMSYSSMAVEWEILCSCSVELDQSSLDQPFTANTNFDEFVLFTNELCLEINRPNWPASLNTSNHPTRQWRCSPKVLCTGYAQVITSLSHLSNSPNFHGLLCLGRLYWQLRWTLRFIARLSSIIIYITIARMAGFKLHSLGQDYCGLLHQSRSPRYTRSPCHSLNGSTELPTCSGICRMNALKMFINMGP